MIADQHVCWKHTSVLKWTVIVPMKKSRNDVHKIAYVLLLSGLAMLQSAAQEASESQVESSIVALEQVAKLRASRNKDIKTRDALLDEAVIYVDQRGQTCTKAELLVSVQATDSLQYAMEGMIVRVHGDAASATGLYTRKGMIHGKPFLERSRFVDTWLRKNGRWVAIASLSTPNS